MTRTATPATTLPAIMPVRFGLDEEWAEADEVDVAVEVAREEAGLALGVEVEAVEVKSAARTVEAH